MDVAGAGSLAFRQEQEVGEVEALLGVPEADLLVVEFVETGSLDGSRIAPGEPGDEDGNDQVEDQRDRQDLLQQ